MADFTLSPNMNLPVPNVGTDPGPDYANNVNNSLGLIDQHNHTPGNGVAITPSGLNISADLSFLSNNATALRSARFTPQPGALSGASDLGCLYENGVDLFYNDGNGNQIRLTQSGSIAGVSGAITGLVSPASVVFSAGLGKFTFQANTNVAGKIDVGPITVRDTAASANGIDIVSPVALASNYTMTLLPALPGAQSFVTIDNSGNLGASIATSGGITSSNIASATILGSNIAAATIDGNNLVSNIDLPGANPTIDGGVFPIITNDGSAASGSKITFGSVASNGTVASGEGFTSTRNSLGDYTITFNVPFSVLPSITFAGFPGVGTVLAANYAGFAFKTITTSNCSIRTFTTSTGGAISQDDLQFNFIAIGSR